MTDTPSFIGRFRVVSRIGQGGMGSLLLAHDPAIDRLIAIKVLREGLDNDALRERFSREARAAGRLRHANIVTIFDVGEHEGQPFIAMEYLPGETLAEIIRRRAPFSLSTKLKLIEQLCDGLAYAHKSGMVHRDVKPANMIIDSEGGLKILDFGIVRLAESGMTQAGMIVGTLNYMSPEQVAGGHVDHRSDIFAVGAVAYELLSYEKAYPGDLQDGVLFRIMSGTPASLEPAVPPSVAAIITRAMDKDPGNRYPDLTVMRRKLERAREALSLDEGGARASADLDTDVISTLPSLRRQPTSAEKRRAALISGHLTAAQDALGAADFERAIVAAEEVIVFDPTHSLAGELIDQAHRGIVARELERARQALDAGNLESAALAIARLDASAESGYRSGPIGDEISAVRADFARAQERVSTLRAHLDGARASLEGGAPESALRALDDALGLDPTSADALRLRAEASAAVDARARAVVDAARERAAQGDHEGALGLLREAHWHPTIERAEAELLERQRQLASRREAEAQEARRTAEQRAQQVAACRAAVGQAIDAADLDRAEVLLRELRGLTSDREHLEPLERRLAERKEEARLQALRARVERLHAEAHRHLEAGELGEGARVAEEIARLAPADQAGTALRARVSGLERAVSDAKAQVAAAVAQGDAAAARRALDEVRRLSRNDGELEGLDRRVADAEVKAQQAEARRRQFEDHLQRAESALAAGDLGAAADSVKKARKIIPADDTLVDVDRRVQAAVVEARERQAAIAAHLKDLKARAKRRDHAGVVTAAQALLAIAPGNADGERYLREATGALAKAEARRQAAPDPGSNRQRGAGSGPLRAGHFAAIGLAVVVILGGLLWGISRPTDSTPPSTPAPAPAPETTPSPAEATPAEPEQPDPSPESPEANPPSDAAAAKTDEAIKSLVTRAQLQLRRGQRSESLETLRQATRLRADDPSVAAAFDVLARDAREHARRGRQAADKNAYATGTGEYSAAAARQRDGEALLRKGALASGIETLWRAGDAFGAAASLTPPPAATPPPAEPEPTPVKPDPPAAPPKTEPPPADPKPPPADPKPAPVDEGAEVRAVMRAYAAAWSAMDLQAVQRLHVLSAQEVRAVRDTFEAMRSMDVTVDVASVKLGRPDRAVVMATVTRRLQTTGGGTPPGSGQPIVTTYTLEKRNGRWVIVGVK